MIFNIRLRKNGATNFKENQTRAIWQVTHNRFYNKSQENNLESIKIEGSTTTKSKMIAEYMIFFLSSAADQILLRSDRAPLKVMIVHDENGLNAELKTLKLN